VSSVLLVFGWAQALSKADSGTFLASKYFTRPAYVFLVVCALGAFLMVIFGMYHVAVTVGCLLQFFIGIFFCIYGTRIRRYLVNKVDMVGSRNQEARRKAKKMTRRVQISGVLMFFSTLLLTYFASFSAKENQLRDGDAYQVLIISSLIFFVLYAISFVQVISVSPPPVPYASKAKKRKTRKKKSFGQQSDTTTLKSPLPPVTTTNLILVTHAPSWPIWAFGAFHAKLVVYIVHVCIAFVVVERRGLCVLYRMSTKRRRREHERRRASNLRVSRLKLLDEHHYDSYITCLSILGHRGFLRASNFHIRILDQLLPYACLEISDLYTWTSSEEEKTMCRWW